MPEEETKIINRSSYKFRQLFRFFGNPFSFIDSRKNLLFTRADGVTMLKHKEYREDANTVWAKVADVKPGECIYVYYDREEE